MYKVLVLFLLILSQCHLSNISSSDFLYLFPSEVVTSATLDSYEFSDVYLRYKISVYHKHGIQKIVVSSMSGAANSTVIEKEGVISSTVEDTIALNADDNLRHTIHVTIYPMTGDAVVSSFTITKTI